MRKRRTNSKVVKYNTKRHIYGVLETYTVGDTNPPRRKREVDSMDGGKNRKPRVETEEKEPFFKM